MLLQSYFKPKVPKVQHPTSEDIVAHHDKYVAALEALYAEYNPVYGEPKLKLVVA